MLQDQDLATAERDTGPVPAADLAVSTRGLSKHYRHP